MLRLIARGLSERNERFLMLTGESKDRQQLVDRFEGGEADVFLISLKAGGVGLTLTSADTVVHYDPWWNPAAQDQATDRAYRIGQTQAGRRLQPLRAGQRRGADARSSSSANGSSPRGSSAAPAAGFP